MTAIRHRYRELDAIRGIAALMVVLYHYTVRYGEIYTLPFEPLFEFEIGQYGVHLFFIVSGFVIFLTLERTTRATDFIVSRFSRLYPPYWFAVFLTFSVVYIFSLEGREVDISIALINLTMLQDLFKVAHVDGVYWTLTIELLFYFIMFSIFVSNQLKRIELISVVWLLIIILTQLLSSNQIITIHKAVQLLFLLEYGHLFIAGIMFYKIMHNDGRMYYGILLLSLLCEYYINGVNAILIGLYFTIFLLFSKNKLHFLSMKPLIFLGTISYSLYLIHQNVGYVVIQTLNSLNFLNPISIIAVPLSISLIIAILMQRYVEKPSLILFRNHWKKIGTSVKRNLLFNKYL